MKIASLRFYATAAFAVFCLGLGSASQFARAGVEGNMEIGLDRYGLDFQNFPLPDGDPASCRQACERDNRCVAWTFVKPGVQGPQAVCWMKNQVPQGRISDCCISGVMNNRSAGAPPPMPTPMPPPGAPGATGTFQAVWASPGPDVVSSGTNSRPDGAPDGSFRLDFPGERRTIQSIDLIAVNAQNERMGSHWSTSNGGYWVIVTRSNAGFVNPNGMVPNLNLPAQPLTIFAANNGSMTPGARFEIEVTFTDGSVSKSFAPAGNI